MTTLSPRMGFVIPDDGGAGGDDLIDVTAQIAVPHLALEAGLGAYHCTAATRPTTNNFAGRLIYETDTKNYFKYDGAAWQIVGLYKCTSATRPTAPTYDVYAGLEIFETDTKVLLVYDGVTWQPVRWPNGEQAGMYIAGGTFNAYTAGRFELIPGRVKFTPAYDAIATAFLGFDISHNVAGYSAVTLSLLVNGALQDEVMSYIEGNQRISSRIFFRTKIRLVKGVEITISPAYITFAGAGSVNNNGYSLVVTW